MKNSRFHSILTISTLTIISLFFFTAKAKGQLTLQAFTQCEQVIIEIGGGIPPYTIQLAGNTTTTSLNNLLLSAFVGSHTIIVTDADAKTVTTDIFIENCGGSIIGNHIPCTGECSTYSIDNGTYGLWSFETTTGNVLFSEEGLTSEYCWPEPGFYVINFSNNGEEIHTNVTVSGAGNLEIISLANTTCQADPQSPACEKTCAHSTAIYAIEDNQEIEWTVEGAESFMVNGNQVEVLWGEAGSGTITANEANSSSDLNILCSSFLNTIDFNFGSSSEASGGTLPYSISWNGPNGFFSNSSDFQFTNFQDSLEGKYIATVTDANESTASCYVILKSLGDCMVAYDYSTTNTSSCDTLCDGSIIFNISDGQNGNFIYSWSNGSSTKDQYDLCSGDFFVDVFNDICELNIPISVDCNQLSDCSSEASICIEILAEPEAQFSTLPAANNGTVNICAGGSVIFNNESIGASLFEWNLGTGDIATTNNAEQTYLSPGTYEVALIARNDCFCGDTAFVKIEVADAITPSLDCVGTVCEGETVTYSTDASCSDFSWNISGNFNILAGGGNDNFIEIEWISGPEGIIELTTSSCAGNNYCLEPTVAVIPIISDDATIKGPKKVCRMDEVTYMIDDYSATDFVWTVSNGGKIIKGQNTSSIIVRWKGTPSSSIPQTVSVAYNNCYLGCGGDDLMEVYILPKFFVEGDIEVCANGITNHSAIEASSGNPVNCDWAITSSNETVLWTSSSTNSISLDWGTITSSPGKYTIQATPSNPLSVCGSEYTAYVTISEPPAAPTSIIGENQICAGAFYTYEVISSNPDNIFNWTITDGTNIINKTGKKVNVSFGATPPYLLSVTQTSTSGFACESAAINLNLTPISSFTLTGNAEVCEESESTYTIDDLGNVEYNWVITPATAGTIISGIGTNSIDIFWHKPGNADLSVSTCSLTKNFSVVIIAKPEPIISGDLFVCPGASTTISLTQNFSIYSWQSEDGTTLSNTPTATLGDGAYEINITNSTGCKNNTAFEIEAYPNPEINISVNGSRLRCYAGTNPSLPAEIHATEIPTGYTYQWYLNGLPLTGETSSTLFSTDFGQFKVAAVDIYGCESYSNTTSISNWCGSDVICNNPNLPQGCSGGTNVQMTYSGTSACNKFNFQNTSPNYQVGTINWYFDDPASGTNNTTLENPSHTFSKEGHFIVIITGKTPAGILCWDADLVTVPIHANFDFGTACSNEVLDFVDITGFLPGEVLSSWSWNFGDPASGTSNTSTDQNPSHLFSEAGTYTVKLTTTNADGCTSTKTKEVIIQEAPTITFDDPNYTCQATALGFFAQASSNVVSYEWNFGDVPNDANTSEIQAPYHAYNNVGSYAISCLATNIWGCSNSFSKTITIEPNTLSGLISFSTPSPICEGSTTTLSPPAGGTSWSWSNGLTTEHITLNLAESLDVTITNSQGCEYTSPIAILEVTPAPTTTIQAIEYDESGQPINTIYDTYSTCEGEDVFLQVSENGNYSYTWSNGAIGNDISFTEARGNLLADGTYTFTVTVFDNTTGCSNTVGPFSLTIHPSPTNIQISSDATPPICAANQTTLTVNNPNSDLTYIWNTGELKNSIQVSVGGTYLVRGITSFGCIGESNEIEVLSGPDIKKIPNGCHSRCVPDTICLPSMPNVTSYQWYLNGSPIASPEGNIGNLIAEESGEYYVEMIDNIGCKTISDVLNLDLYIGYGDFTGDVYMDINSNGVIDSGDTLVRDIDIILSNNGAPIDTTKSDANGHYAFNNIHAIDYQLQIDVNALPHNVFTVYNNLDTNLVGCDAVETIDWLLYYECTTSHIDFGDTICFGETYVFNGTTIPPNTPTTFNLVDAYGCDSIVVVTIMELPNYDTDTTLYGCENEFVVYNGNSIAVGTTSEFTFTSSEGCSYVETVEVLPYPNSSASNLTLNTCPGTMASYNGEQLPAGSQTTFILTNQYGCDSTVTVAVLATDAMTFTTETNEPCWNSSKGIIKIPTTIGAGPFEYSIDGFKYQPETLFENLKPNTYNLRIRDTNGCISTEAVKITPTEKLEFELTADDLPCDGQGIILEPTIISGDFSTLKYLWTDGSSAIQIPVNQSGTYTLSITNECETTTNEVLVNYELDREEYIYIPNTFSPNGDGINDVFELYLAPNVVVESMTFSIFDRWGKHIYQAHETSESWNGRSPNDLQIQQGVFVYYLKATITSCGRTFEITRKGDITISQ